MSIAAGAGVVLGSLVAIALLLRALSQRFAVHPELLRKLFHIGAGIVSLALPWLFDAVWPIAAMAGVSSALLLGMRFVPFLRNRVGHLLGGVERVSWGELYFPVSVCVLFALSREEPVIYAIPLLILTFADSLAALIGVSYGRFRYEATEGNKSMEGSAAFFLVAFLCTHVPLLLGTDTGRAESLLIALILGILAMLLESVAWRGLDNLFVPLASYALLHNFLPLDAGSLVQRFLLTVGAALALLVLGRRSTLTQSGLVSAFLVGYFLVVVGGWSWLFPPLLLFLAYRFLTPSSAYDAMRMHKMRVILSVNLAGLMLVTISEFVPHPALNFAFFSNYAAHLAIIGLVRCQLHDASCRLLPIVPRESLKAWAAYACLGGVLFWVHSHALSALHAGLLLGLGVVVFSASLAYATLVPQSLDAGDHRWHRQAWCAAGASVLALLVWFGVAYGVSLLGEGVA